MPPMKVSANSNNNSGGGGGVGGEESEGDVSGVESERSNSSHEADRHHDSSEADEDNDSDDSSEMDEGECELRRTECMDNLADLEKQFTMLREQLYRERMAHIEFQLAEIRAGRSPEYLEPLHRLDENKEIRVEVAGILRQLRMDNIRNKCDAEEQASLQNFESEKHLAWDWLHDELMDKIRRLEEDRHNVELSWGEGGEWNNRSRARGGRRKAVTVSGPYIVYMLSQQDIIEDWAVIRKALKRSPS